MKYVIKKVGSDEWLAEAIEGGVKWSNDPLEITVFMAKEEAEVAIAALAVDGVETELEEVSETEAPEKVDDLKIVGTIVVEGEGEDPEEVEPEGVKLYTKIWAAGTYPGAGMKPNMELAKEAACQQVVDGNIDFHLKEGKGGVLTQSVYFNPKEK